MLGRANRAAAPVAVASAPPSDFFSSCWADILQVELLVNNRADRTAKSGEMANATIVSLLPYVCIYYWLAMWKELSAASSLVAGAGSSGSFCEIEDRA